MCYFYSSLLASFLNMNDLDDKKRDLLQRYLGGLSFCYISNRVFRIKKNPVNKLAGGRLPMWYYQRWKYSKILILIIHTENTSCWINLSFYLLMLPIGYPFCPDNSSSYIFQKMFFILQISFLDIWKMFIFTCVLFSEETWEI